MDSSPCVFSPPHRFEQGYSLDLNKTGVEQARGFFEASITQIFFIKIYTDHKRPQKTEIQCLENAFMFSFLFLNKAKS